MMNWNELKRLIGIAAPPGERCDVRHLSKDALVHRLTVCKDGVPYPTFGFLNPTARGPIGAFSCQESEQMMAALEEVERQCGALVPVGPLQTLLIPSAQTRGLRWPRKFASDDPTHARTLYMILDCLQLTTSLVPVLNQIVADYAALARTRTAPFTSELD